MNTQPAKGRDKEETKQRLVQAALGIIRKQGFADLGINAVSEAAGVSKVLIYRYFGGLDGLLQAIAAQIDPLQSQTADRLFAELGDGAELGDILQHAIVGLHKALKSDELTKRLLVWELSQQNAVTQALADARERTGRAMTEQVEAAVGGKQAASDYDTAALLAIISAGVFYLTLRSDSVQYFNGIDISSPEGWERMARAIANLMQK